MQAAGKNITLAHPSEELLAYFHTQREGLPVAERLVIERHLRVCSSCREELSALTAFDFSLLNKWKAKEP
jgi:hypothetical protein